LLQVSSWARRPGSTGCVIPITTAIDDRDGGSLQNTVNASHADIDDHPKSALQFVFIRYTNTHTRGRVKK